MVWRRRRIRDAEAKDKARAETKIVLAPGGIHVRTDDVRHEIVDLSDAPRDVLVQYHIDAATCSKRKCILATVAGQREPAMSAAKQKFRERHKVIKLAQIQTRTEQVARDSARDLVAIDVAIEMIAAQLCGQPEKAVCVIRETAGRAVAIEVAEPTARIKVDVAVACVDFEPGNKLAGCARILRGFCRLRTREWSCFRNCWQSKDSARRRDSTFRRRRYIGGRCSLGCRLRRTVILLPRDKRNRKEHSQSCCCTPLTHKHPP